MRFVYEVEIDVDRISGKFASRDDISTAIGEALDDLDGAIDVSATGPDGDSEYEVSNVSWSEIAATKRRRTG